VAGGDRLCGLPEAHVVGKEVPPIGEEPLDGLPLIRVEPLLEGPEHPPETGQVPNALDRERDAPPVLLEQRVERGFAAPIPERAEQAVDAGLGAPSVEAAPGDAIANAPVAPRPILLLPEPESAQVVAIIPDGPPRQFRWRGVMHQVAEAEGPERITPEWWRRTGTAERDYYVVEDTDGRRFWLYRDGLYGTGDGLPQWFVHGVLA